MRALVMAVAAVAATPLSADTVRPGPAIALPYGDIIIPVPAPPSNADPMNPASPGDVVTQRYNNLRTGTTLHGGLDQSAVSVDSFGLVGQIVQRCPRLVGLRHGSTRVEASKRASGLS